MESVTVTTIVENAAGRPDLEAEHGLSYWIEAGDRVVLFDAGQSDLVLRNAVKLGLDMGRVTDIVVSHAHYDHTRGLAHVLPLCPTAKIWMHAAARDPKYAADPDGKKRSVGMPQAVLDQIAQAGSRVMQVVGPVSVGHGLFMTGQVTRLTDFEDTGGPFFADPECTLPDPLYDDQSMFFDTSEGIVVVLGCAHAGVINTLWHIQRITDNRPIHAVLGGMHLTNASPHRLDRTIESLRELGVRQVTAVHCTGLAAAKRLREAFGESVITCSAGTVRRFT